MAVGVEGQGLTDSDVLLGLLWKHLWFRFMDEQSPTGGYWRQRLIASEIAEDQHDVTLFCSREEKLGTLTNLIL